MLKTTFKAVLLFGLLCSRAPQAQVIKALPSPFLKKLLKKYKIKESSLQFALIDMDSGKLIKGHHEEKNFNPASLTKIYTAAYALEQLGASFKFQTTLHTKGEIKDGILKGDLYLKGTGDPTLSMARLMDLAMELRNRGIKKVEGSFYYDDTSLPPVQEIAKYGLGDQTYNPSYGALNLEYNRFWVWRAQSKHTKRALFKAMPPLPHLSVEQVKAPFSPGKEYHFAEDRPGEVWQMSERQRYGKREEIPIRRPSRFTAATFRYFTQFWGIAIPPPRRGKVSKGAKKIGIDESQPLLQLLKVTLEYSNNLYAEQILLKAAGEKTLAPAAQKMQKWVEKKTYKSGLTLINGSGLSAKNRVQAYGLANFIHKWALKPFGGRGFMSLLSISGQTGWLKRRLAGPETAFRVWAKTGSLDYVNNMAGVIFTNSGKRLSFSVGIVDHKKRIILNGPNSRSVNKVRARASRWRRQSGPLLEELISHWVNIY